MVHRAGNGQAQGHAQSITSAFGYRCFQKGKAFMLFRCTMVRPSRRTFTNLVPAFGSGAVRINVFLRLLMVFLHLSGMAWQVGP